MKKIIILGFLILCFFANLIYSASWPFDGQTGKKFDVYGSHREQDEESPDISWNGYHPGIDIAADKNTDVKAVREGMVEYENYK